jgi:hypothetical protein
MAVSSSSREALLRNRASKLSLGLALLAVLIGLCGCVDLSSGPAPSAAETAQAPAPPEVYLFRGLGGRRISIEMDRLAALIEQNGTHAEVNDYLMWITVADKVIAKSRHGEPRSEIVAIGHSAGGDAALRFAERLQQSGIAVSLVVTIDPTRLAPEIPGNVGRFINVYESANFLGGGNPSPAHDFHGAFASIDLKDRNVSHQDLPKLSDLQTAVAAKVAQLTLAPTSVDPSALPISYAIPHAEPIELWDSGVAIRATAGDTASSVAAKYSVPVWAIAEINRINPSATLTDNQRLVIPHNLYGGT